MRVRKTWIAFILGAIIMTAFLLTRFPALDRYATIDETKWLLRSANFYQALQQGELENTYQSEHPGVPVMWAGTAGLVQEFRGYALLAGEQMPGPTKFQRFLQQQKQSTVDLLSAGRLWLLVAILIAHGLTFIAAIRLVGFAPASLGFILLAFDPFLISLSRILHLDGLSSALMLLSLLWLLDYLLNGQRWIALLISGAAAGASWLTKSPAVFLIPFAGLLMSLDWFDGNRRAKKQFTAHDLLITYGRAFLIWVISGCVIAFVFWPALWVDPIGVLKEVFSEALAYTVSGNQNPIFFNGAIYASGDSAWYFYPTAYLWRATPATLIGLMMVPILLLIKRPAYFRLRHLQVSGALVLFAGLYILTMSFAGQKYARYILPAMLALNLVAGIGWYWLLSLFYLSIMKPFVKFSTIILVATGLMLSLVWGIASTYPYYYQYFNPLLGGIRSASRVMQIGWGEGLDQAARYLNTKPDAGQLRVISWYGDAPFAYFFKGKTINMPEDAVLEELLQADYVVIYYQQYQRQLPSPEVLAFFQDQTPEYIVTINGLDYVEVFNIEDISIP